MATIVGTRGVTLPDSGTKADLHNLTDLTTYTISNIVNADVSSSAAIAGTKISPNFGSQDITTTGDVTATDGTFSGAVAITGAITAGSGLGTIKDYGTSGTTGTTENFGDVKIYYGTRTVGGSSSAILTNLPFASATSYIVQGTVDANSTPDIRCLRNSGSQVTIYNNAVASQDVSWIAIGT